MLSLGDLYLKQSTVVKNKMQGVKALRTHSKTASRSLAHEKELAQSESRLESLVRITPGRSTGAINQYSGSGQEDDNAIDFTYRWQYQENYMLKLA